MKLFKLTLLMGAMTFAACDDGNKTTTDGDTDTDATGDSDTDTDAGMDTDDSGMMMACYEDGEGGDPFFDLCEYDDDWEMAITRDCAANSATFVLRTNNWGYGAAMYVADTRFTVDYDEEHTLTETDTSADAAGYSVFELALETNTAIGDVADGKSLFDCENGYNPEATDYQATYAFVVYTDATQSTVSDCVVFGENAQELIDNAVVGGSGQAAAYAYPSWLNATNCTAL